MMQCYFTEALTREQMLETVPCKTIHWDDPVKVIKLGRAIFAEKGYKSGYTKNHRDEMGLAYIWSERRQDVCAQSWDNPL